MITCYCQPPSTEMSKKKKVVISPLRQWLTPACHYTCCFILKKEGLPWPRLCTKIKNNNTKTKSSPLPENKQRRLPSGFCKAAIGPFITFSHELSGCLTGRALRIPWVGQRSAPPTLYAHALFFAASTGHA